MITFKASYMSTGMIKEKKGDVWKDKQVSFVSLNCYSKRDLDVLYDIAKTWKSKERCYASSIFNDAYCDSFMENKEDVRGNRYYAITAQKSDFHELKSEDVLCISKIQDKLGENSEIVFLQTNPNYNYYAKNSKYKNIGCTFLKVLQEIFPSRNFILDPDENALNFYKKMGLEYFNGTKLILKKLKK